jgi:hypothetical protein
MYLGEYENDKMPRNNDEYIDSLLKRRDWQIYNIY